jgi:hypothetical protein
MNVAILTTVSSGTPWASIVMPGRLEYCIRHGYAMVCLSCDYHAAHTEGTEAVLHLLKRYDLVWALGADCLITNHTLRIEDVAQLGPHMSICEEGLGDHALVNGDSIVWRSTPGSVSLLDEILVAEPEWRRMTFTIQDWLMAHRERLADRMTILPKRTCNSVHYGEVNHWHPGDFVYHPCGAAVEERIAALQYMQEHVVR